MVPVGTHLMVVKLDSYIICITQKLTLTSGDKAGLSLAQTRARPEEI